EGADGPQPPCCSRTNGPCRHASRPHDSADTEGNPKRRRSGAGQAAEQVSRSAGAVLSGGTGAGRGGEATGLAGEPGQKPAGDGQGTFAPSPGEARLDVARRPAVARPFGNLGPGRPTPHPGGSHREGCARRRQGGVVNRNRVITSS